MKGRTVKRMTLIDLINTWNLRNDKEIDDLTSFFEGCVIDSRLDRDIVIMSIIDECGSMKPLYNVSSTMRVFTENWFKKYQWNIGKLCDTLDFEYDPLTNKRTDWTEKVDIDQNLATEEDIEESRERNNTGTQSTADTGTQSKTNTGTQSMANTGTQKTENTGTQRTDYDEDVENTISAMNESGYQPDNKSETDGGSTRTDDLEMLRTDNLNGTRTDNLNEMRTDNLNSLRTDNLTENIARASDRDKNENLQWNETDTHEESGLVNGTFQDLIEKERKIAQFSIYNWIAKKYASEMFLLVY